MNILSKYLSAYAVEILIAATILAVIFCLAALVSDMSNRRVQAEPPVMTTPRAQDAYVNGERVKVLAYADYDMAKVERPDGVVTYVKRSKLVVF
jgi:hypothetical protein